MARFPASEIAGFANDRALKNKILAITSSRWLDSTISVRVVVSTQPKDGRLVGSDADRKTWFEATADFKKAIERDGRPRKFPLTRSRLPTRISPALAM